MKLRWAVLGTAKIATQKVIPAMQRGKWTEVAAIASRDLTKAGAAARELDIPKAYGSYEEALADPEIDAVYIPLPNHLHVPWSIRAAEAGKHVLCEKPIGLSSAECRDLIAARDRSGVRIGEAFMVRTHPQWIRARELVRSGAIGELKSMLAAFSYFNRDAANIRNVAEWGGGAMMDIGCYPVQIARFLFGEEPIRVSAQIERDPDFHIDRLSSAVLAFRSGHCAFTCGTQMAAYQTVRILGTEGRIEVEIPFNAPPDRPCRIFLNGVAEEFPVCDQYTIQSDLFSRAAMGEGEVPTPLEDSLANMKVLEAVFEAAHSSSRTTSASPVDLRT